MAYLAPSNADPIPTSLIAAMGEALHLTIPEEDLNRLSTALRDQLASVERIESLDLDAISPPAQFDPRWHD